MIARWAGVAGLLLLLPLLPSASSMTLKLDGNVYPTGHFYVTLHIGDPMKPYFLDIDTGSSLTWLECNIGGDPCTKCDKVPHGLYQATPSKLVPCAHQLCDAVHKDLGTKNKRCPPLTQCDYEIEYLEGSKSIGVLLRDNFTFPTGISDPAIAFGCGYDQGGNPEKETAVDGILGLGRGGVVLVSQLKNHKIIAKNVVAHCLSRKGGYLLVREEGEHSSSLNWVPMAPKTARIRNHYSPGLATLHLGTKSIGTKVDVVLDSGSTYTYLPNHVYSQLVSALKASLSKLVHEVQDPELTLCWERPGKFTSLDDLKKEFKSVISLKFSHEVTMLIPPENYIIISKSKTACLGILGMQNHDIYLIGDITMQDQLVIYDNENRCLAWMPSLCEIPKSAIVSRI